MIMFVDNSYDMKILVRIYTTDHATNGHILSDFHDGIPGSTLMGRLCRDRMPGQDSNVTGRQALLGSPASARQNLTA